MEKAAARGVDEPLSAYVGEHSNIIYADRSTLIYAVHVS